MSQPTDGTTKLVLCPYCGNAQMGGEKCLNCHGLFEPLSRRATQLAMGPWQIRDKNHPFRPGCCYDIIKKMAAAGKIKPTSVMRGPTTRQFWSVARNVPGVAHLIGYCHVCGNHVSPSDAKCGDCSTPFTEPRERNLLGLAFKDDEEAARGQAALDAEMRGEAPPPRSVPGPTKRPRPKPAKSGDLLTEILDLSDDFTEVEPTTSIANSPASVVKAPKPLQPQPSMPKPSAMPVAAASAFDVEPTRELPDSSGPSPMVMLLIAMNIIAIGAIVVFILMSQ